MTGRTSRSRSSSGRGRRGCRAGRDFGGLRPTCRLVRSSPKESSASASPGSRQRGFEGFESNAWAASCRPRVDGPARRGLNECPRPVDVDSQATSPDGTSSGGRGAGGAVRCGPVGASAVSLRAAHPQLSASPHRLQRVSGDPGSDRVEGSGTTSASTAAEAVAVTEAAFRDGRGSTPPAPEPTSTNSSRRTGVRSSMKAPGGGTLRGMPAAGASAVSVRASQQARISSPRSGRRSRSNPQ